MLIPLPMASTSATGYPSPEYQLLLQYMTTLISYPIISRHYIMVFVSNYALSINGYHHYTNGLMVFMVGNTIIVLISIGFLLNGYLYHVSTHSANGSSKIYLVFNGYQLYLLAISSKIYQLLIPCINHY